MKPASNRLSGASSRRLQRVDIAALLCLAAFALYFLYMLRDPFRLRDEPFYLTIPHRYLKGDSMVVDDWHLSQMSSFFQYPFVWAFYKFTGGTEGIVLFARCVYLLFHLLFCVWLYWKLRRCGWAGLCAVCLYCGYQPFYVFAIYYNSVCIGTSLFVALTLFTEEKLTKPKLLLIGVALGFSVIAEPFTLIAYPIYTVLMIVCRARKKEWLENRAFSLAAWGWITGGALLCAAAFLPYMLRGTTIKDFIAALPELTTDYEYQVTAAKSHHAILSWEKYVNLLTNSTGWILPILALGLLIGAGIDRRRTAHRPFYVGAAALMLTVVCGINCYLMWKMEFFAMACFFLLPLYLAGPLAYVLTEHRDRRLLCWWLYALIPWFAIDLASDLSVALGCAAGLPAAVLMLRTLWEEMRRTPTGKKAKRRGVPTVTRVTALLACAAVVLLEGAYWFGRADHRLPEQSFFRTNVADQRVPQGPLKGIRATQKSLGNDARMFRDLDSIIERNTDGAPVYVIGLQPVMYLYMDFPYAGYSSWYVGQDLETRQVRYWQLHPDKRPAFIYVPYEQDSVDEMTVEEVFAALGKMCDCSLTEGAFGYILETTAWHLA